jgi:adenylate kinase
MHKYLIMGPQGCGKGTQARMLKEAFDLVHICVGDIFRWHVQNHTKMAARIKRLVAGGGMVSDEVVEEIVKRRLELHDWNYGFILDGFPRTLSQAQFFLESYDIDAVILIHVPDEVVIERVLSRRLCKNCGVDYNLSYHPPAHPDRCDACGGPLVARDDDTPEAVRRRLQDYHAKTEPVLDLFRRKELVVVADGAGSVEQVQEDIRRKLGLTPSPAKGAQS